VDYVMLGGAQTMNLKRPAEVRLGDNSHAIRGGIRLWDDTARKHRDGGPPTIAS